MKRRNVLFAFLLLITGLLPFVVSEAGESTAVTVTVNGETRQLDWDDLFTKDGKMTIRVTGFKKTDRGEDFGMLGIIAGEKEIKALSAEDDGQGHCTYTFENSSMPDAVFLYAADGSGRRILIWKTFDFKGAVPAACVGQWKGSAVPKKGGDKFTVTLSVDFDGQGLFKYKREDSAGMLPFTAKITEKKFTAIVANELMPITKIKGNWKISKGKLKLTATVTYRDEEEKETFTVTLKKVETE